VSSAEGAQPAAKARPRADRTAREVERMGRRKAVAPTSGNAVFQGVQRGTSGGRVVNREAQVPTGDRDAPIHLPVESP
jgi:hypothetical protein